ncbi:redoxin domain-containing protein [Elizabethkingia argentiflava]|uniref:Redoxin domain-containing protein n=1 Tax=Elizabethkingia argenteiflava TaxID=2681556 RepID=A0A845PT80_9FLAO|nr:TlpA disulfide reductase family protein [Elizabethkingia argenteiflava]NAW51014.1 redoxin domain-containing protein [Elizabethkingia argenteiflava]
MKKLLFGLVALLVLIECKKSDSPVISPTTVDNAESLPPSDSLASSNNFVVYDENKLADLLKTKDNDTLYITNFFATWCGPCMMEIPHFKAEMEKLKGKKTKFTFVSVDAPEDWDTKVKEFGNIQGLSHHIVLFDMKNATENFAQNHTQSWDGGSIPFTRISKGNKIEEKMGSFTAEEFHHKIKSFQ